MSIGIVSGEMGSTTGPRNCQPLARSIPGLPVSFDQIEERSRKQADGSLAVDSLLIGKTYRDSAGRIRIETKRQDPAGNVMTSEVVLLDPTSNSYIVLSDTKKTALRIPWPISADGMVILGDVGLGDSRHKWQVRSEDLGKRPIGDEQFSGTRIISTAEDDRNLGKISESWYSEELKVFASITIFGPTGAIVIRMENLRREEPNPALFRIPSDYRTIEAPLPSFDPNNP